LKGRINNLSDSGNDPHFNLFTQEIKNFQQWIPVILSLGNKDMKAKHWKTIYEQVHPMFNSRVFTINSLIYNNILDKKDILMEISQKATGEQLIQNQISNIKKKWDEQNFMIIKSNDQNETSDGLKIVGIDDII
jgi:hypothetical protein